MQKTHPWKNFGIGVALIMVPVLIIAWWIFIAQTNAGDHADKVEEFLSPFPSFLQSPGLLTWIQLAFCGIAGYFSYKGLDEKGLPKVMSLLLLCFSGLIGFWLVFSLM